MGMFYFVSASFFFFFGVLYVVTEPGALGNYTGKQK